MIRGSWVGLWCVGLCAAVLVVACGNIRKTPGLLDVVVGRPAVELTVMSFNIRYNNPSDGPDAWPNRADLLASVIRSQKPDVVGLQEALDSQLADLAGLLPEYAQLGVGRDDGQTKGEYSAVLYRVDRLIADESKTFWYSETPERPGSRSWGNRIPRICTFALFTDRATQRQFRVFNSHLDHESERSRCKSVELLAKAMYDSRRVGVPVIVTGDFNCPPSSPSIEYMTGRALRAWSDQDQASVPPSPRMVDTWAAAGPKDEPSGTFHAFKGNTDGQRIDYIFVDSSVAVLGAGIDRTSRGERFASDHFAVWAKVKLPS